MKRKKPVLCVLMAVALTIVHLPGSEADAATSASDFKMEGSTLVRYQGKDKNVTIPDTVETIGRGAFEENKNIELVEIPNSVENIEPYAFWGCDNLEGVDIGKGLDRVGDYAFSNCNSLKSMVLPSNVSSIGIRAFEDCIELTDITIPPQTEDIHESAFEGCSRLSIHYEEGSAAEEYAKNFYERQKSMSQYEEGQEEPSLEEATPVTAEEPVLTPVPQPTSMPTETPAPIQRSEQEHKDELGSTLIVGSNAVVMVNNNRLPVFGGAVPATSLSGDGQELQNTDIPKYAIIDGKAVADQAYYRSTALGDVVLPQGIQEIGEFAFARSSATSAVLPEGVEYIGYGAFYHCDDLQEVVLPETVRCVEPKAFSHTMWVQNFLESEGASAEDDFLVTGGVLAAYRGNTADVTVPEGVRVIAGEVFRDHTEIEKVSLPDSLLVVGEGAFEGCSSLSQIVFGENVEEIKDRAFLGNVMSEISIPTSVKKAGLQAFGNAIAAYQGQEAEYTYENSATRLSNGIYRGISNTGEAVSGVTVTGLEAVFGFAAADHFSTGQTSLLEADGSYTLNISQTVDTAGMEAAFKRVFQNAIPDGMLLYELELTDESGIPLKKLGKQTLSVVLPVPDAIKGKEPVIFTLDGNGQLERLEAEAVDVDGIEAFRFETNHPSVIGVCGAQNSELPSSENATEPAD